MPTNRQDIAEPQAAEEPLGSDDALSLALMRDNARRSLARTRDAMAERGDDGRSVPLPVPGLEVVSIGQALEAAFLHLETLRRTAEGTDDVDPLDWHEDLLAAVDLTHLSRAGR